MSPEAFEPQDLIRVSCATLCRIEHRARFLLLLNAVALNPLQALMPFASLFRVTALVVLVYLTYKSMWREAAESTDSDHEHSEAGDRHPVTP